ncbi:helix-turn-helix domain-containing protein [Colwelliaceae bacterium MEBiC 14330]
MDNLTNYQPVLGMAIKNGLAIIKAELKTKGIKYAELAELMGTSEVTVKRMLNNDTISLSRMMFLAQLLDLELAELITQVGRSKAKHSFFNESQDQAFYDNPKLWSYFVELFYNHKSPADIEKEFNLSQLSTYKYLRALDKIGLILLAPKNNFTFLVKAPIGFNKNSKVINRHITHMMEVSYKAVMLNNQKDDDYFLRVKPMRLSKPVYLKLIEELKEVMDKYAQVSEIAFADAQDYQVVFTGHRLIVEDLQSEGL